jgi:hypothetical protein
VVAGIEAGPARVIVASIVGGTASVASGGKFANGALTAAFSEEFNELLHPSDPDYQLNKPQYEAALAAPGPNLAEWGLAEFFCGFCDLNYSAPFDSGALQPVGSPLDWLASGLAVNAVEGFSAVESAAWTPPSMLARVIPDGIPATTLGAPAAADVFVTTPQAIEGLDAAGIAERLTIPQSPSGFQVIEFSTPDSGLASPVFRSNPGFIQGGFSAGGAPEFVIPNGPIPAGATIRVVH